MPAFDIGIVGAGPAGSTAARLLGQAGARVAIFDASHPREKPCGGGVSARALAELDASRITRSGSVEITSSRFSDGRDTVEVPLPRVEPEMPALVVCSRKAFDLELLDEAREAGAELVPRRISAIERATGGWTLRAGEFSFSCQRLVGADGANSFVRRMVSRPFERSALSIASGYYVHGRSDSRIDIAFTASPPGYLWSFPRPDHLAVGVCAQADATSSAEMLAASEAWIRRNLGENERALTRYSWPIPSLSAACIARERPAGEGWLLVGDAAGLVDPITREGIFYALASARIAAECLMRSDAASRYLTALRSGLYRELHKAARMKHHFFNAAFTGLLVQGLERSAAIRRLMAGLVSGTQTYEGLRRRLLLTGELRLAFEYLKLRAR